jgi:3-oxoacyl-[acyl-carrier-protein] synthase II
MGATVPVAITGIGIISPIGVGRDPFWSALCAGTSGVRPVTGLARPSGLPRIGAPVGEFGAKTLIASPHFRRMDRLSRMAVAASRLALDDARAATADLPPERIGIVFGTALGAVEDSIAHLARVFTRGPAAASPMAFPNLVLNAAAGYAAIEHGWTGVNFTVAQHEISGEHAIALGSDVVASGRADVVLAGGGDELVPIVVEGYHRARALAGQRGGREWASPYDAERSGIVLGEGAAVLVLEPLARARQRGATVYAVIERICAYAVDAPRYDWPRRADAAVATLRAVFGSEPIDLVYGGANSSRRLDGWEQRAIEQAQVGGAALLTSIKGAVGEFGAAGALTVAAASLALHEQTVSPLCHLEHPPARTAARFAGRRGAPAALRRVLVSGLARGGSAIALVLRAADAGD